MFFVRHLRLRTPHHYTSLLYNTFSEIVQSKVRSIRDLYFDCRELEREKKQLQSSFLMNLICFGTFIHFCLICVIDHLVFSFYTEPQLIPGSLVSPRKGPVVIYIYTALHFFEDTFNQPLLVVVGQSTPYTSFHKRQK